MKTSVQYIPDELRVLGQPAIDVNSLLLCVYIILVNIPGELTEEQEAVISEASSRLAFLRVRMANGRPLQEQQHN